MKQHDIRLAILALTSTLACGAAGAGPAPSVATGARPDHAITASATPAAPLPPRAAPSADIGGSPAGDAELDKARGGADTTTIDTRLTGQVNGNLAINVQSGWNVIDGGAFANMSGIPIVIQNSGSNVLIQNATVIELKMQ